MRSLKIARLFYAQITPGTAEEYDWPSHHELARAQRKTAEKPPLGFKWSEGIIQNEAGVFWVPQNESLLQLRIIIASHTGRGGHRGIDPTQRTVQQHFYWKQMREKIEIFVKSCLHCLCTATGSTIPRPLDHAVHADMYTVHKMRLKCFRNKDFEDTSETLEQLHFQDGEYSVVEKIEDIRKHQGVTLVLVRWSGF